MKQRILVVVDMQNDFIYGPLAAEGANEILVPVIKKMEVALAKGEQVMLTMDTHYEDYLSTKEGKKLPVPHCIKGTVGWELIEPIRTIVNANENIKVMTKNTFGSCQLVDAIRLEMSKHKEVEIELVGVCTDICVVSNALLLKANFPEISISVDASCCAGVTKESHEAALLTMKMCQINI